MLKRLRKRGRTWRQFARERLAKERDLLRASRIDVSTVRTVCLTLGPYRNLTTLTAAIVALHPQCQVLNHGGRRIFGDRRLDFFSDYSEARFTRFVRYALEASRGGERGNYGGSIIHSHAFGAQHAVRRWRERIDTRDLKRGIRCLYWKESLRTANHIRDTGVDLRSIFDRNPALRFLMPIRNPMDCALSNIRTGHVQLFRQLDADASAPVVISAVLDEIAWFLARRDERPDRYYCFFDHEFGDRVLLELADFLAIEPAADWRKACLESFDLKGGYTHDSELRHHFETEVGRRLGAWPEVRDGLLRYTALSRT